MLEFDAKSVAHRLLSLGCVRISVEKPFSYASGLQGPLYCDNRLILGHPKERSFFVDAFEEAFNAMGDTCHVILGLATGGITHAALLAERLRLPMGYVRAKAKAHGHGRSIEGGGQKGQKALLIEDLVNQGSSLQGAVEAIKGEGLEVSACLAIVDYQTAAAKDVCKRFNLKLVSLTNFDAIVEAAIASGAIDLAVEGSLRAWHNDPQGWSP